MACDAYSTSRRALLSGLVATSILSGTAIAAAPHPDAALFAMRDELTALIAADEAARKRFQDIEETVVAMVGPAKKEPTRANFRTFNDFHKAVHHWKIDLELMREKRVAMEGPAGLIDAEDAATATSAILMDRTADLAAMRATTLDGLIFKAGFLVGDQNALRDSIVDDLLAMGGRA